MNKPLGYAEQRDLRRKAEDATMAGADIILSTLSSSLNREMEKYFVQGEFQIKYLSFFVKLIRGINLDRGVLIGLCLWTSLIDLFTEF